MRPLSALTRVNPSTSTGSCSPDRSPKPGEYYWVDLEGLRVETVGGVPLGILDHVFATGANDVLAVRGDRERLIPFIQPDVVTQVDFDTGVITVDWDPDF